MDFKQLDLLKNSLIDWNVNYSVYPYNGYTINEVLCQFFDAINKGIVVINDYTKWTDELLNWVKVEGISTEVIKTLNKMIEDGVIQNLINNSILKNIQNDLNNRGVTVSTLELKYPAIEDKTDLINEGFKNHNCVIVDKDIFINKTLTIPYGKILQGSNESNIKCNTNIDVIKMRNKSYLRCVNIIVECLNYTRNAITVEGTSKIDMGMIENVYCIALYNNNPILSGNGVYFNSMGETETNNYISFFVTNNLKVQNFEKGLYLNSSGGIYNYVNGNLFNNIVIVNSVYPIVLGSENSTVNGNKFTDVQIQSIEDNCRVGVTINQANNNVFNPIHFWDFKQNPAITVNQGYYNTINHNISVNHELLVTGNIENHNNMETVNGFPLNLTPYEIGTKNVGYNSNRWKNGYFENTTTNNIKCENVFEGTNKESDYGYALSVSKWGYLSLLFKKGENILQDIRIDNEGLKIKNNKALGDKDNRTLNIYTRYIHLVSDNGTAYVLNVSDDGSLSVNRE